MRVTYTEAKQRALKVRDIWVRRLIADPITTPIAFLLARYTRVTPTAVTILTFALGIGAAAAFAASRYLLGAVLYFSCFLSDGTDGKLTRVRGEDDTYRGMLDFLLDGIVCLAVVVGLGWISDPFLLLLLLTWMSFHYLDMRFTSAVYRLKVQRGATDVWLISPTMQEAYESHWILSTYRKTIERLASLRTYPHPTVGEAVLLMFVVGPIAYHYTQDPTWMHACVGLGILCVLPETFGAGLIAYLLAKEQK